jgi:hypothetical protein
MTLNSVPLWWSMSFEKCILPSTPLPFLPHYCAPLCVLLCPLILAPFIKIRHTHNCMHTYTYIHIHIHVNILQDWIKQNPHFQQHRADVNTHLTPDALETMIDLFETRTAFSKDPISLVVAEKAVAETFSWTAEIATKIVPEVYKFWLQKREKLGKPVSRKFWPPTQASDSNPYNVFRVRDKERYRLRKQTRKNDVDSFRYDGCIY